MRLQILRFGLSLAISLSCFAAQSQNGSKTNFLITLPNRQFSPVPGIEQALTNIQANASEFPVHGIVQLFRNPTEEENQALKEAGVQLRNYMGRTAYLADVSSNARLALLTNWIRWAGVLLPSDRVETNLWSSRIGKAADGPTTNVLVRFHRSVATNDVRAVLERHTLSFRPFGMNGQWAVSLRLNRLEPLAAEHTVFWIQPPTFGFPLLQ
jgi:hypothetical protein